MPMLNDVSGECDGREVQRQQQESSPPANSSTPQDKTLARVRHYAADDS
jgi:hypothetical protein